MKNWSDIQIAYLVAKYGTLSRAAEVLDVHHSTVLRHIDAIEERLSCKLFHRHTRGYTPTEAGLILLQEAEQTEERLERMVGKINGIDQHLSGPFIITSVSTLSPIVMPAIEAFKRAHPNVELVFQAASRIFKLEYGEAHVSVRPGAKPQDPDYVVQKLIDTDTALYASADYIKQYGDLKSLSMHQGHRFVSFSHDMSNIKAIKWIEDNISKEQISFRGSDFNILMDAARAGLGIVALDCRIAEQQSDLLRLSAPQPEWRSVIWLVTHRDIHRSPKVQAFTTLLKSLVS